MKHTYLGKIAMALLCLATTISCGKEDAEKNETSPFIGEYNVTYYHHHVYGKTENIYIKNGEVSIVDMGDNRVKLSGYMNFEGTVTDNVLKIDSFVKSSSENEIPPHKSEHSFEPATYDNGKIVIKNTVTGYIGTEEYNEDSTYTLTKKSK